MVANEKTDKFNKFKGKNGIYEIMLSSEPEKAPKITAKFKENLIIEKDMGKYLSDLLIKYPTGEYGETQVAFEDMHLILEGEDISMLVVFESIDVYSDNRKGKMDYSVNLHGIYIKYK
ncbi:MAG: hypothetical protein KA493_00370 [Fusobacteriaceae bacterium]|nr:hypothetical protein [Fusobacteriaceae bacterium]